jgi:hypothetical protein
MRSRLFLLSEESCTRGGLWISLNTVQRSSLTGIRPWGFAKGGVAMLMRGGLSRVLRRTVRAPRGIVRFDHLGFR